MNNHARQLLFQLIQDHGLEVAKNPQKLNALFKDYAEGQYRREIFLCVQAAREGVVETLLNNKHLPYEAVAVQLTQRLHDDYGLDLSAAKWAVGSWVVVLGLTDKFPPKTHYTSPEAEAINRQELQQALLKLSQIVKPAISKPEPLPLIADRYQDNADGTIIDTKTQLHWLRFCVGQTWTGTSASGDGQRFKWYDLAQTAQDFNDKGGFANYQDWQVPSIDELQTLVELGKKPSINHSAFPATPASLFWSSTPADHNANSAWSVYFYGGSSYWYGKGSFHYLRLVRKANNSDS